MANKPIARKSKCATQQCLRFFQLSRLFFANEDIYNVNEIPDGNEFQQTAKDMAAELGIDWQTMTHDDSNRIVINLLTDAFMAIKDNEGPYKYSFNITVTKPDSNGKPDSGDNAEV